MDENLKPLENEQTHAIYDTLEEAEQALAQVNLTLGYPRHEENGYIAETWARIEEFDTGRFGFIKPVEGV